MAIISQNSPEYVVAVLGIIKSGLIVTTLNPLYTPGMKTIFTSIHFVKKISFE